jgi:hypothetical protein
LHFDKFHLSCTLQDYIQTKGDFRLGAAATLSDVATHRTHATELDIAPHTPNKSFKKIHGSK